MAMNTELVRVVQESDFAIECTYFNSELKYVGSMTLTNSRRNCDNKNIPNWISIKIDYWERTF